MKLRIVQNFDQKLAEMYSSKVTVNLDTQSNVDPNEIWSSMEMIAVNRKAMINFKVK